MLEGDHVADPRSAVARRGRGAGEGPREPLAPHRNEVRAHDLIGGEPADLLAGRRRGVVLAVGAEGDLVEPGRGHVARVEVARRRGRAVRGVEGHRPAAGAVLVDRQTPKRPRRTPRSRVGHCPGLDRRWEIEEATVEIAVRGVVLDVRGEGRRPVGQRHGRARGALPLRERDDQAPRLHVRERRAEGSPARIVRDPDVAPEGERLREYRGTVARNEALGQGRRDDVVGARAGVRPAAEGVGRRALGLIEAPDRVDEADE